MILLALKVHFVHKASAPIEVPEELQYETFSEPPAPAEVPKPIAKTPEPDEPEEQTDEPDDTPKEIQDSQSEIAGTQAAAKPVATTGAEGTGDAATTPYYRIKPKYPRAALVSGVEGFILLKVDITEAGTVENVRVIGGQERNMFQDEARRAVEKWKYKPFTDASGKVTRKVDHEIRVDFTLKDA
jgi:protein TonB